MRLARALVTFTLAVTGRRTVQFTLYYRGKLKAKARPVEKHALRRHIHHQLKKLWHQKPLDNYHGFLTDPPEEKGVNLLVKTNGFAFVPLVSEKIALVAELDILLLWPQPAGAIISAGGDIDNRLKTLFDSLKVPIESNALPPGIGPAADEIPFFCLLEEDRLITRVSVQTDQLLEPVQHSSEVALFIRVHTRQLAKLWATLGFP